MTTWRLYPLVGAVINEKERKRKVLINSMCLEQRLYWIMIYAFLFYDWIFSIAWRYMLLVSLFIIGWREIHLFD